MSEKSNEAKAGAPKKPKAATAGGAKASASARAAGPSAAQLDERDWHKAGPRRLAGPPLAAGRGPAAAAISAAQMPPSTDPKS